MQTFMMSERVAMMNESPEIRFQSPIPPTALRFAERLADLSDATELRRGVPDIFSEMLASPDFFQEMQAWDVMVSGLVGSMAAKWWSLYGTLKMKKLARRPNEAPPPTGTENTDVNDDPELDEPATTRTEQADMDAPGSDEDVDAEVDNSIAESASEWVRDARTVLKMACVAGNAYDTCQVEEFNWPTLHSDEFLLDPQTLYLRLFINLCCTGPSFMENKQIVFASMLLQAEGMPKTLTEMLSARSDPGTAAGNVAADDDGNEASGSSESVSDERLLAQWMECRMDRKRNGATTRWTSERVCTAIQENVDLIRNDPSQLLWLYRCKLLCARQMGRSLQPPRTSEHVKKLLEETAAAEQAFAAVIAEGSPEKVGAIGDIMQLWTNDIQRQSNTRGTSTYAKVIRHMAQSQHFYPSKTDTFDSFWQRKLLIGCMSHGAYLNQADAVALATIQVDVVRRNPRFAPINIISNVTVVRGAENDPFPQRMRSTANPTDSQINNAALVTSLLAILHAHLPTVEAMDTWGETYEPHFLYRNRLIQLMYDRIWETQNGAGDGKPSNITIPRPPPVSPGKDASAAPLVDGNRTHYDEILSFADAEVVRFAVYTLRRLLPTLPPASANPVVFLNSPHGSTNLLSTLLRLVQINIYPCITGEIFQLFTTCIHHNVRDVTPTMVEHGVLRTAVMFAQCHHLHLIGPSKGRPDITSPPASPGPLAPQSAREEAASLEASGMIGSRQFSTGLPNFEGGAQDRTGGTAETADDTGSVAAAPATTAATGGGGGEEAEENEVSLSLGLGEVAPTIPFMGGFDHIREHEGVRNLDPTGRPRNPMTRPARSEAPVPPASLKDPRLGDITAHMLLFLPPRESVKPGSSISAFDEAQRKSNPSLFRQSLPRRFLPYLTMSERYRLIVPVLALPNLFEAFAVHRNTAKKLQNLNTFLALNAILYESPMPLTEADLGFDIMDVPKASPRQCVQYAMRQQSNASTQLLNRYYFDCIVRSGKKSHTPSGTSDPFRKFRTSRRGCLQSLLSLKVCRNDIVFEQASRLVPHMSQITMIGASLLRADESVHTLEKMIKEELLLVWQRAYAALHGEISVLQKQSYAVAWTTWRLCSFLNGTDMRPQSRYMSRAALQTRSGMRLGDAAVEAGMRELLPPLLDFMMNLKYPQELPVTLLCHSLSQLSGSVAEQLNKSVLKFLTDVSKNVESEGSVTEAQAVMLTQLLWFSIGGSDKDVLKSNYALSSEIIKCCIAVCKVIFSRSDIKKALSLTGTGLTGEFARFVIERRLNGRDRLRHYLLPNIGNTTVLQLSVEGFSPDFREREFDSMELLINQATRQREHMMEVGGALGRIESGLEVIRTEIRRHSNELRAASLPEFEDTGDAEQSVPVEEEHANSTAEARAHPTQGRGSNGTGTEAEAGGAVAPVEAQEPARAAPRDAPAVRRLLVELLSMISFSSLEQSPRRGNSYAVGLQEWAQLRINLGVEWKFDRSRVFQCFEQDLRKAYCKIKELLLPSSSVKRTALQDVTQRGGKDRAEDATPVEQATEGNVERVAARGSLQRVDGHLFSSWQHVGSLQLPGQVDLSPRDTTAVVSPKRKSSSYSSEEETRVADPAISAPPLTASQTVLVREILRPVMSHLQFLQFASLSKVDFSFGNSGSGPDGNKNVGLLIKYVMTIVRLLSPTHSEPATSAPQGNSANDQKQTPASLIEGDLIFLMEGFLLYIGKFSSAAMHQNASTSAIAQLLRFILSQWTSVHHLELTPVIFVRALSALEKQIPRVIGASRIDPSAAVRKKRSGQQQPFFPADLLPALFNEDDSHNPFPEEEEGTGYDEPEEAPPTPRPFTAQPLREQPPQQGSEHPPHSSSENDINNNTTTIISSINRIATPVTSTGNGFPNVSEEKALEQNLVKWLLSGMRDVLGSKALRQSRLSAGQQPQSQQQQQQRTVISESRITAVDIFDSCAKTLFSLHMYTRKNHKKISKREDRTDEHRSSATSWTEGVEDSLSYQYLAQAIMAVVDEPRKHFMSLWCIASVLAQPICAPERYLLALNTSIIEAVMDSYDVVIREIRSAKPSREETNKDASSTQESSPVSSSAPAANVEPPVIPRKDRSADSFEEEVECRYVMLAFLSAFKSDNPYSGNGFAITRYSLISPPSSWISNIILSGKREGKNELYDMRHHCNDCRLLVNAINCGLVQYGYSTPSVEQPEAQDEETQSNQEPICRFLYQNDFTAVDHFRTGQSTEIVNALVKLRPLDVATALKAPRTIIRARNLDTVMRIAVNALAHNDTSSFGLQVILLVLNAGHPHNAVTLMECSPFIIKMLLSKSHTPESLVSFITMIVDDVELQQGIMYSAMVTAAEKVIAARKDVPNAALPISQASRRKLQEKMIKDREALLERKRLLARLDPDRDDVPHPSATVRTSAAEPEASDAPIDEAEQETGTHTSTQLTTPKTTTSSVQDFVVEGSLFVIEMITVSQNYPQAFFTVFEQFCVPSMEKSLEEPMERTSSVWIGPRDVPPPNTERQRALIVNIITQIVALAVSNPSSRVFARALIDAVIKIPLVASTVCWEMSDASITAQILQASSSSPDAKETVGTQSSATAETTATATAAAPASTAEDGAIGNGEEIHQQAEGGAMVTPPPAAASSPSTSRTSPSEPLFMLILSQLWNGNYALELRNFLQETALRFPVRVVKLLLKACLAALPPSRSAHLAQLLGVLRHAMEVISTLPNAASIVEAIHGKALMLAVVQSRTTVDIQTASNIVVILNSFISSTYMEYYSEAPEPVNDMNSLRLLPSATFDFTHTSGVFDPSPATLQGATTTVAADEHSQTGVSSTHPPASVNETTLDPSAEQEVNHDGVSSTTDAAVNGSGDTEGRAELASENEGSGGDNDEDEDEGEDGTGVVDIDISEETEGGQRDGDTYMRNEVQLLNRSHQLSSSPFTNVVMRGRNGGFHTATRHSFLFRPPDVREEIEQTMLPGLLHLDEQSNVVRRFMLSSLLPEDPDGDMNTDERYWHAVIGSSMVPNMHRDTAAQEVVSLSAALFNQDGMRGTHTGDTRTLEEVSVEEENEPDAPGSEVAREPSFSSSTSESEHDQSTVSGTSLYELAEVAAMGQHARNEIVVDTADLRFLGEGLTTHLDGDLDSAVLTMVEVEEGMDEDLEENEEEEEEVEESDAAVAAPITITTTTTTTPITTTTTTMDRVEVENPENNEDSNDAVEGEQVMGDASGAAEQEQEGEPAWAGEIEPVVLMELPEELRAELIRHHIALLTSNVEHDFNGRTTSLDTRFLELLPPDIQQEAINIERQWVRVVGNPHSSDGTQATAPEDGGANANAGETLTEIEQLLLTTDDELRRDILQTCDLEMLRNVPHLMEEALQLRGPPPEAAQQEVIANQTTTPPGQVDVLAPVRTLRGRFLSRRLNMNEDGAGGRDMHIGRHDLMRRNLSVPLRQAYQQYNSRNRQIQQVHRETIEQPSDDAVRQRVLSVPPHMSCKFSTTQLAYVIQLIACQTTVGQAPDSMQFTKPLCALLRKLTRDRAGAMVVLDVVLFCALEISAQRRQPETVRDGAEKNDGNPVNTESKPDRPKASLRYRLAKWCSAALPPSRRSSASDRSNVATLAMHVLNNLTYRDPLYSCCLMELPDGATAPEDVRDVSVPPTEMEMIQMNYCFHRRILQATAAASRSDDHLPCLKLFQQLNQRAKKYTEAPKEPVPASSTSLARPCGTIMHPRHHHPLQWINVRTNSNYATTYTCDVCRATPTDRETWCFHCKQCSFDLCAVCGCRYLSATDEAKRLHRHVYWLVRYPGMFPSMLLLLAQKECSEELATEVVEYLSFGILECARRASQMTSSQESSSVGHLPVPAACDRNVHPVAQDMIGLRSCEWLSDMDVIARFEAALVQMALGDTRFISDALRTLQANEGAVHPTAGKGPATTTTTAPSPSGPTPSTTAEKPDDDEEDNTVTVAEMSELLQVLNRDEKNTHVYKHVLQVYAKTGRHPPRELLQLMNAIDLLAGKVNRLLQRFSDTSKIKLPTSILPLVSNFFLFNVTYMNRNNTQLGSEGSFSIGRDGSTSCGGGATLDHSETERLLSDVAHVPSAVSNAAVKEEEKRRRQMNDTQNRDESYLQTDPRSIGFGSDDGDITDDNSESHNTRNGRNDRGTDTQNARELGRLPSVVRRFMERNRVVINALLRSKPDLLEKDLRFLMQEPQYIDFDLKLPSIRNIGSRMMGGTAIEVSRASCLADSFNQMTALSRSHGPLRISFRGEEGTDVGGLLREWFEVLSREIVNDDYALFIKSNEAKTLQPNPLSDVNPNHLDYFRFCGIIVGLAIAHNVPLDLHFSRAMYRHMIGIEPVFRDLESLDPQIFNSLQWLLTNDVSDLGLTFTVTVERFGQTEDVNLVPNGSTTHVTNNNKKDYIRLRCSYYMTKQIEKQLSEFLCGLYTIVPRKKLQIFTEQELELVICGMPDIDIEDMRAHTVYEGYASESRQIRWFWDVVASMSKQDLANLVQFTTGSSKVPHGGFRNLESTNGSQQRFTICRTNASDASLPLAHTCFNRIDLPAYSTAAILREKLMLAITYGATGFAFA